MRILHLSDTHGCHHQLRNLPEADVAVHSGDFTMNGSQEEAIDFKNWFCDLPYDHKIFICGNHDECIYGANVEGLDSNVHYLCNSGVEIDGVTLYGVPMLMGDCISEKQSFNYLQIPSNTNVLVTHTPPFGILDFDDGINYGSEELLNIVSTINPRLHLFGHIHRQHGILKRAQTTFSNGAILSANYSHSNTPNVLDISLSKV
ncbi:MAG: metallophosphatase domain-containing protein [Muribaculaceae bacterium]|nr:metallophosphatase domain-containing protein [Muribaculaceae bacterium]